MDAEWIKHDGGECPIPWAKEGEWEALRRMDSYIERSMPI